MNNINLNNQVSAEHIKASDLANWLLSRGISSITTEEIAAMIGVPKSQVPQRMASLKRRNAIVSPAQGLWIPVPPEYMSWGAPPAIDIIDALMRHMNADYYVGWLSASEIHGASHHAPQVFQVATSRAIRLRTAGRSRFRFFHRAHIEQVPLTHIKTRNGVARVSSRETTLLDIANDIGIVGGIDNAANLVIELCEAEALDIDAIASISAHFPVTATRRLGYLMETYTDVSELDKLREACANRNASMSVLDPQAKPTGAVNTKWNLRINGEVSPDV